MLIVLELEGLLIFTCDFVLDSVRIMSEKSPCRLLSYFHLESGNLKGNDACCSLWKKISLGALTIAYGEL